MRKHLSCSLSHPIWSLLLSKQSGSLESAGSDPLGIKQVKMADRPRIKHFLFFCIFQDFFSLQMINNNKQSLTLIIMGKSLFLSHTSFSCIQKHVFSFRN